MVMEEAAELIVAVNKYKRHRDESTVASVIEEMVDVMIMIEQLKLILKGEYGSVEIEKGLKKTKKEKLQRLKWRVEGA